MTELTDLDLFESKENVGKLKEVFERARNDIYEYHYGNCRDKLIKQLKEFEEEMIILFKEKEASK